jgi:hypothetical protein
MGELTIREITGHFVDRDKTPLSVFAASGERFAAFAYSCILNLDKDGAANAYGYDNPANEKQNNLVPLELAGGWKSGWDKLHKHKHKVARSMLERQRIGLGNACGDPGDGTKGHVNFNAHSRNFYWAGVMALTKKDALRKQMPIDERPDVEAGREKSGAELKPVGEGYFPVINPDTGYYISTTRLAADDHASIYNPSHYLDSNTVAYAVWANAWNHVNIAGKTLRLGDFGLAIENETGHYIPFVYGDSGTPNKVGECSKKIHDFLEYRKGLVTFIGFPGSGSGRMIKAKGKKTTYKADALGANPERLIEQKARLHMANLSTNAAQLAEQVSNGGPHQTHVYQKLLLALSTWTVTV